MWKGSAERDTLCTAKKRGNEVSSVIHNYIKKHILETANEIHVFSDSYIGYYRNHKVLRTQLVISHERKIPIKQYLPKPGDIFLTRDRIFGVTRRAIKKKKKSAHPRRV